MTQYPNEKNSHSNWVYPDQRQYPYTSRNGAPATEYHAPPQGPPPDYEYPQSHPPGPSSCDHGNPPPTQETAFAPPPGPGPYGAPEAGPSSWSAQDGEQGSTAMSLGSFFGNKGPPPMWQRQAPLHLPYNAFPPMCLISNGSDLSKGFPELPPPCQLNPHPFATHDVTEEDWKRFLTDVKKAGSLSPAQRIKSNVIPMVTGLSFVTGFIATFAIEKRMKHKNRGAAGDLVDHWNHYFFGPRRMEAVLCQASERLSGRLGGAVPVGDPRQEQMASGLRRRGDDSDSESSSDDDSHGHGDKQTRRAARRERRATRREARRERRARKARGDNKQPYQLYITAV